MRLARLFPALIICMMVLPLNHAWSQDAVSLSGFVFDTVTGRGLPFAQISVKNSTIGTVTNEEGLFNLEVPARFARDTILIAYLGYATLKRPVREMQGNARRLPLEPVTLQLAEVEIIALTPEEVIRRVVANIPRNYGKDSLILTAFVRSQKFVGGRLAEFTEAIIEDLKTGYALYEQKAEKERSQHSNIPLLLKGRVISDTSLVNSIGDLGKSAGCLGCNFIHDYAEFYRNTVLDENLFPYYTFTMEERIQPEGGKVYHILFDQKKGVSQTLWKGEMFINGVDFALLKIKQRPSFEAYSEFEKRKYKKSYTIGNTSGWYQEMPMMEWATTYSFRNGLYYLNTITIQNWLTFKNPATGKTVKYAHKNDVVVTEATREPEKLRNFRGDKSIGVNQRWDQVIGKGDEYFWAGFNYLPVEQKLHEDLRKLGDH